MGRATKVKHRIPVLCKDCGCRLFSTRSRETKQCASCYDTKTRPKPLNRTVKPKNKRLNRFMVKTNKLTGA